MASETDGPEQHKQSAIRNFNSHLRFFGAAAVVLALDLFSKSWVFSSLKPDEGWAILPHIFELRRSLNDGAVFGSFTGQVWLFIVASVIALGVVLYLFASCRPTQRWLHIALACILAGAMGNLYDRALMVADIVTFTTRDGSEAKRIGRIVSKPGDSVVRIGDWPEGTRARSFMASEVRMRRQGVVRDFIKFVPKFPSWVPVLGGRDVWPWIFNVADASLVCGVGVILLSCRPRKKPHESAQTAEA